MHKETILLSALIAMTLPLMSACGSQNRAINNNTATSTTHHSNRTETVVTNTVQLSTNTAAPPYYSYAQADMQLTSAEKSYKNQIVRQYQNAVPTQWGENSTGVLTHMVTSDKAIALTFDACGGRGGSGYDAKLINYLIQQHIPATLFINDRWIDENYSVFMTLAKNPLFEIENHGYLHSPLSINGKPAWGIPGTQNAGQVVDEILVNADKIQRLTGRRPIYFRSGTAYYDEDAVRIADGAGARCVNFSILGDAGATFNTQQIVHACLQAKPGSVIICHMNHPEKDTAEGIMAVVPLLKQKGFHFVTLDTYPLA